MRTNLSAAFECLQLSEDPAFAFIFVRHASSRQVGTCLPESSRDHAARDVSTTPPLVRLHKVDGIGRADGASLLGGDDLDKGAVNDVR